MRIGIPELSVVALVGVSGSGRAAFAKAHFDPGEVLSLGDTHQAVDNAAINMLYAAARRRLELGLLTVIDAPYADREARAPVLRLAKDQDCVAVAIMLDMPEKVCQVRGIRDLKQEGFRQVHVLRGQEEAARAEILRVPLASNKKEATGPFDIIGDIHGCYDELCALLCGLGYGVEEEACAAAPPRGRRGVFLGDLCDRGPKNVQVLRLVMGMVRAQTAYCVAGNHDAKLARYLKSGKGKLTHGLDVTVEQLAGEPPEFVKEVKAFTNGLGSHYVLDGGRLVVAHAGLKERYQGRSSARVRSFCLYGDTTGEVDEYGLPVRLPWANEYRGKALVVYGHTPLPEVQTVHNAVCIDTGCVFGGKLTAYRYPEGEILQVDALRMYYQPGRPLFPEAPGATGAPRPFGS